MTTRTITLRLPESLYTRLQQAARATRRSLDDVLLHAVQVGSPPGWDDAPAEFQADLAALDRLDDEVLWRIAHKRKAARPRLTTSALPAGVATNSRAAPPQAVTL